MSIVDRIQVEFSAKQFINQTLSATPTARDFILTPHRFDKFIDLLHTRTNELSWAIHSRYALLTFIRSATIAYCEKQLSKAEIKSELSKDPNDDGPKTA